MREQRINDVAELLAAWRAGDAQAPQTLATLVYADLHAMAARRLADAGRMPLQASELVHEVFVRRVRCRVLLRKHWDPVSDKFPIFSYGDIYGL